MVRELFATGALSQPADRASIRSPHSGKRRMSSSADGDRRGQAAGNIGAEKLPVGGADLRPMIADVLDDEAIRPDIGRRARREEAIRTGPRRTPPLHEASLTVELLDALKEFVGDIDESLVVNGDPGGPQKS